MPKEFKVLTDKLMPYYDKNKNVVPGQYNLLLAQGNDFGDLKMNIHFTKDKIILGSMWAKGGNGSRSITEKDISDYNLQNKIDNAVEALRKLI